MNDRITLWANYYQHFDADFELGVPGEGYGGWKKTEIEIAPEHTAVVVMHAWDCGTREEYPGWHRAVEYIPRSYRICADVFPALLSAVRASPLRLYHVVSSGAYCATYPGYQKVVELAGPEPPSPEPIERDRAREKLDAFRAARVFPGSHNQPDIARGQPHLDFPSQARPSGEEPIAATTHQLFAMCKHDQVSHLIYAGFAINWCLLMSPGGMLDMSRHGVMCSALRQAVTAVENKETARQELAKEIALWRVALAFGFVFDVDDFVAGIRG